MLKTIIFYTVVIVAPLILIVYFFFKFSTVVLVHNTGAADTMLSLVIDNSRGYERTDEKRATAGGIALLEFTPQTEGALSIRCKKDGRWTKYPLDYATANAFFFAWVTMKSCNRLLSTKVYRF